MTLAFRPYGAVLEVSDDGCGPAGWDRKAGDDGVAPASGGFGLGSMRTRAEELGGSFEVRARAGGGTKIVATVPYGGPEPAGDGRL